MPKNFEKDLSNGYIVAGAAKEKQRMQYGKSLLEKVFDTVLSNIYQNNNELEQFIRRGV
jgi:hypothetical protein